MRSDGRPCTLETKVAASEDTSPSLLFPHLHPLFYSILLYCFLLSLASLHYISINRSIYFHIFISLASPSRVYECVLFYWTTIGTKKVGVNLKRARRSWYFSDSCVRWTKDARLSFLNSPLGFLNIDTQLIPLIDNI